MRNRIVHKKTRRDYPEKFTNTFAPEGAPINQP